MMVEREACRPPTGHGTLVADAVGREVPITGVRASVPPLQPRVSKLLVVVTKDLASHHTVPVSSGAGLQVVVGGRCRFELAARSGEGATGGATDHQRHRRRVAVGRAGHGVAVLRANTSMVPRS
jgi:hypothetical protein